MSMPGSWLAVAELPQLPNSTAKGGDLQVLYLPREEKGQGLVEYALILVLVVIVVVAILTIMGPQIGNIFSRITSALTPK